MKTVRALTASLLFAGSAGFAQAVPIYFDFTGTVTSAPAGSSSTVGSAVSGSFEFETDAVYAAVGSPPQQVLIDYEATPGTLRSDANLDIGGAAFDALQRSTARYVMMQFTDCNLSLECAAVSGDSFMLYAHSTEEAAFNAAFTGTYMSSSLMLLSLGAAGVDYFNYAAGANPLLLLTAPVGDFYAQYTESLFTCVLGSCQNTSSEAHMFTVDSFSRGVRATTDVPTPGPLVLLGGSLALIWLSRRRLIDLGDRLMLRALRRD
jgi:hypothetical protein